MQLSDAQVPIKVPASLLETLIDDFASIWLEEYDTLFLLLASVLIMILFDGGLYLRVFLSPVRVGAKSEYVLANCCL